jgi:hypothetical protein
MNDNLFFDYFSKENQNDEIKNEIIQDLISAIHQANFQIRQNIQSLEVMIRLLNKEEEKIKKPIKKSLKELKKEKDQMYMFSIDADGDAENIDEMIQNFIDHLKEIDPNVEIDILENPEDEDE